MKKNITMKIKKIKYNFQLYIKIINKFYKKLRKKSIGFCLSKPIELDKNFN